MTNYASIASVTKKKFVQGPATPGGDPQIMVLGAITMDTQTTTDSTLALSLTGDIPSLEGVIIQGDAGFQVQYDYSNEVIEIYCVATGTTADQPMVTTTAVGLDTKVFKYIAWGY